MHARLSRTRLLGFTLLELIVTVVVLGILAALAVPAFSAVIDRTKDEALAAELEALGRGVAALAAFDGELTTATVGEFLAAEPQASDALGASSRWTALPDGSLDTPATAKLYVHAIGGYLGGATAVTHRNDRVAYLLVGASGGAVTIIDTTDGTWGEEGAHALCFYGVGTGCTAEQESAASGDASSVGGPVATGASGPATDAVLTVLLRDDFDGTGDVVGGRTPTGDFPWVSYTANSIKHVGGAAEAKNHMTTAVIQSAAVDPGQSDGVIRTDMAVTVAGAGSKAIAELRFRRVGNDHWSVRYRSEVNTWDLVRQVGGQTTVLQEFALPTTAFEIHLTGSDIAIVDANGQTVAGAVDEHLTAGTGIVLYGWNVGGTIANYTYGQTRWDFLEFATP